MATVTKVKASIIPVAGYLYTISGLTAGQKNTVTLTGVVPDYVPNGALVWPLGASLGSACYDPAPTLFVKDPSDATQVLIDIYPTTVTVVGLWIW